LKRTGDLHPHHGDTPIREGDDQLWFRGGTTVGMGWAHCCDGQSIASRRIQSRVAHCYGHPFA
jgi:hypothetical protein